MKKATREKINSWLGAMLIRAIGSTLRVRLKDGSGVFSGAHPGPCIASCWHNRLIILPEVFKRYYRARKGVRVLISQSRDGTLISNIVRRLGIGVVNGSSSRGGTAAALELIDCLRDGFDAGITPDGPRGPRYHVDGGLIFLAQKTGAPIMPFYVEYSRCFRFKSWDGFMVPLPFARVDITIGALQSIGPTGTNEEFEAERVRIEKIMQPVTL